VRSHERPHALRRQRLVAHGAGTPSLFGVLALKQVAHHGLTFLSGFAYEALAVGWVHHAERGHAAFTGLFSAAQALALVFGVGESVRDWRFAPSFIIGHALGAASAVWLCTLIG
jgi:hypothetical protein